MRRKRRNGKSSEPKKVLVECPFSHLSSFSFFPLFLFSTFRFLCKLFLVSFSLRPLRSFFSSLIYSPYMNYLLYCKYFFRFSFIYPLLLLPFPPPPRPHHQGEAYPSDMKSAVLFINCPYTPLAALPFFISLLGASICCYVLMGGDKLKQN